MIDKTVQVYRPRDFNRVKTSITVRLGTKNRLSDIAKKGESFDDVINRLISSGDSLKEKLREYENILDGEHLLRTNKLESVTWEMGLDSIRLSDGSIIKFTYNKPGVEKWDEGYSMDIHLDKVLSGKESHFTIEDVNRDADLLIDVYFRGIEKVVNIHFDPSFAIPKNKNILDPTYWKKVWDRIGLSDHSFDKDILRFIANMLEEDHGG